jgi:hypothetical protein
MSKLRTHFTFRVDTWTPDGESIVEHSTRDLPRRLRTLAGNARHLAAWRASDRGQPALARSVGRVLINAQIAAPLLWAIHIGCPKKSHSLCKVPVSQHG